MQLCVSKMRVPSLVPVALILALASCNSGTKECREGTLLLRLECSSGLSVSQVSVTVTREDDQKTNSFPSDIDCSKGKNVQVEIADYAAGQKFNVTVRPLSEGQPFGPPSTGNVSLKKGCSSLKLMVSGDESDAAVPDPSQDGGSPESDALLPAEPGSRERGEPCAATVDCRDGVCADGVCCESACDGICEACNQKGSPGLCRLVPKGARPVKTNACKAETVEMCGLDGTCDGAGACAKYPDGTVCDKGECDEGGTKGRMVCMGGECSAPDPKLCVPYKCDPSTVDCFAKCSSDAQCVEGRPCVEGSCGKKPLGASCMEDSECLSESCADGFCCNDTCAGACEACNTAGNAGKCLAVAKGLKDPHGVCKSEPSTSCGETGFCNGNRGCSLYEANVECKASTCVGNDFTSASKCDGVGNCLPGSTAVCAPYACGTGQCVATCTSNEQCVGGNVCVNGSCGKKSTGASCGSDGECEQGFCRDRVCCENACAGACRSCNAPGKAGKCTLTAAGLIDPRAICVREEVSTCKTDGTCDGSGGCRNWAPTTECGPPSCNASTNTASFSQQCNGSGACVSTKSPESCAPGRCSGNACTLHCAKNDDCVAPNTCVNNLCGKKPNGFVCNVDSECQNGNCEQGVCCDGTCDGICRACNLSGSPGSCTTKPAGAMCGSGMSCQGNSCCATPPSICSGSGSFCSSGSVVTCAVVNGCLAQTQTRACNGVCDACSNGTCSDVCSSLDLIFQTSISGDVTLTDYSSNGGPKESYSRRLASSSGSVRAGEAFGSPGETRGFMSFDLSAIGSGRQIKSATLSLSGITYGNASGEGDPFSHGALWIEAVEYGTALDATKEDFGAASVWFAEVAKSQSTSFDINVLEPVGIAYTLSPRIQFRFRFLNLSGSDGVGMSIPASSIKLNVRTRLP